ncbi:MAG TPA: acyl-CoA dehydrogenase family protein [Ramlibacter sp.]|nr:acyl-CoA dehydrogenase family protein [Ramlibacter sp.]
MNMRTTDAAVLEPVETFRLRARAWLTANMPRRGAELVPDSDEERWARARALQGRLYEGGFAGICYPKAYGGQGLSPQHQEAFTEESLAYEMPILLNMPTLSIILPTILKLGTEDQKKQHIGAALRGEEILVEFFSEAHSGSDLAGARTRADWDGEKWTLNGSKIWTSSAYVGDYALCLARSDWNVPKHQGLTMFLVPVRHPGITVRRIRQVNGKSEFCEEFLDNVVVGPEAVLGEVNGGWAVATHRFYYSRTALGGGNPYISGDHDLSVAQARGIDTGGTQDILQRVRTAWGDTAAIPDELVDAFVVQTVRDQFARRVTAGVQSGKIPIESASLLRLFHAETDWRCIDASLAVAGSYAVTGAGTEAPAAGALGVAYLFRQATSLGGGTSEMARNVISERVLKMPREAAGDLNIPFRDVRTRGASRSQDNT